MSKRVKSPAIDPEQLPIRTDSSYPEPFRAAVAARRKRALGDAAGLSQFGVNLVDLPPGCWSSQRHWHTGEDEFIYVLEGEVTLITDAGAQRLTAGFAAGFPAGQSDGHHLVNRSDRPARYLEVGTRSKSDTCHYPDIDLVLSESGSFTDKKGNPY
ncbi:MAG TPA: cupin domain-containing protein [Alphaproteobacteria bacterium]|nr:cupin domain-containing protein [Alphaproteobacteria bacterium]